MSEMDPERWERLQELLPRYQEQPAEQQREFLERECPGDESLQQALIALANVPPDTFLEPPDSSALKRSDSDPGLEPGTRVGEFEIVRLLGRGGMGVVYVARQDSLDRDVALKVIPADRFGDRRVSRFEIEALSAARLRHPHIIRVLSAGEANHQRYIAMELIDGCDLRRVLDNLRVHKEADASLPTLPGIQQAGHVRAVAEIIRAIADALHYAHQSGILHRDVKPQNILVDRDGTPYLADFGLAKDLRADSISISGQILGTPYYMSPEQALARRVPVDHRTDVFSLGAVLYESLTLQRPFDGDSLPRVLQAISFHEPPGPRKLNPRIHRDLETICLRALEKDPRKRFDSCAQFADELGRFLAHEPLSFRRSLPVVRLARRLLRNRGAALATGLLLVALLSFPIAWRAMQNAEQRAAIARARERTADVTRVEPAELRGVIEQLRELRTRPLSAAQREEVDAIEERVRAEGLRLKQAGLAARADGLQQTDVLHWGSADARLDEAVQLLLQARILLPGDPELEELSEVASTLPAVRVRGVPPGWEVAVQTFDMQTGAVSPPRPLGPTPLDEFPLARGFYRFVIEDTEGDFCELTRLVDRRGMRVELAVDPGSFDALSAIDGMVLHPGGEIRTQIGDDRFSVQTVEPFHLDATEVTIGDYRRFLRATGYPPPPVWGKFPREQQEILLPGDRHLPEKGTEWDDLPIAGVTLDGARAYAEWRHKRLPTAFEWDLAARTTALHAYPWTEAAVVSAEDVLAHAVVGRGSGNYMDSYLQKVEPARSRPEGATPRGIFHAFGNVKEWTDTMHVAQRQSEQDGSQIPVPATELFIIRGGGYDTPVIFASRDHLDLDHYDKLPAGSSNLSVGFRCARSAR